MGLSHSSGLSRDMELERIAKQRTLAKAIINKNRQNLQIGLQGIQKSQQFYYVGVSYYALSMVGFSLSMLGARTKFPSLQKIPWIAFTVSGYLLGGQFWTLHQYYFRHSAALLVESMKTEMNEKIEQCPYLSQYRAEISALDKIRKDYHLPKIESKSSKQNFGMGLFSPSHISSTIESKSNNFPTENTMASEDPMRSIEDDIVSQVLERNKAMNAAINVKYNS